MKIEEMVEFFRSLCHIAYRSFPEGGAPTLPYFVYFVDGDTTFRADGKVYEEWPDITLELYTEEKDFALENKIKQYFKENEIVYEHYENYVSSEKMLKNTFEFTL